MGQNAGGHANQKNASKTAGTFRTPHGDGNVAGQLEKGKFPPDENFTGKPRRNNNQSSSAQIGPRSSLSSRPQIGWGVGGINQAADNKPPPFDSGNMRMPL